MYQSPAAQLAAAGQPVDPVKMQEHYEASPWSRVCVSCAVDNAAAANFARFVPVSLQFLAYLPLTLRKK